MNRKEFKYLFSNLCCSRCRNDFEFDNLEIIESKSDLMLCHLKCDKCGKDFGDVIFNFNRKSNFHNTMNIIDGPAPISADDVIDAYRFIKKMK